MARKGAKARPIKLPSERRLTYVTGALSNSAFADLGKVCIPKDLSIVNRRNHTHTSLKGVPYIYKVRVNWYPSGLDGSGYAPIDGGDVRTTVKFLTCPNNWVAKQAGMKWHNARNASLKRAGIKMGSLGAYAKTIRYNWEEAATTFLAPYDGDGAVYAGGTWDTTKIFNAIDEDGFTLRLVGSMDNEDGTVTTTDINALGSYLQSRQTVEPDSNLEIEETPADKSLLLATLQGEDPDQDHVGSMRINARGEQDNPPYDEIATADSANDITEPTEAARIVMYPSDNAGIISTVFEVPFGIFQVRAANRDPGDNSGITDDMAFSVEVLDIYEMA